jgi:hypothetical protein
MQPGRSLSACQHAFASLITRTQQQTVPMQPQDQALKRLKRPYSMGDAASPLAREIQPRPPVMNTINGQQQQIPGPVTMSPIEPPRKKRGRPTKSEFERRQAEARERGEVWPKPRNKPKAQRTSTEGGDASAMQGTSTMDETGPEGAGSVVTAGSGEDSSIASAPPASMLYAPGPSSGTPHMSSGQRPSLPYEGMMQSAGQAQDDSRAEGDMNPEPRLPQYQPQQPLIPGMRSHGQMPDPSGLQSRGPQGHVQPYSPQISHPYHPAYQVEDRTPGSRQ